MKAKLVILFLLVSCSLWGAESFEKLVILGSGPAGLSAAIFAGQTGLHPLVLEGGDCDGQLDNVHFIENYPGFPEGITAEDLYDRLYAQAGKFGACFVEQRVHSVNLSQTPFHLVLENGDAVFAEALIIALGAKVKWLGLPSEQALIGKGVSASAICDAPLFIGKEVCVVGSADSALEQALLLTEYAEKVHLVCRSRKLSGSSYLQEKVMSHPKISIFWECATEEILGVEEEKVIGIRLRNVNTAEVCTYPCDGIFVAIGRQPNTDLFKGQLMMAPDGYLLTDSVSTATNIPGVFAAGDIADPAYRKLITAAASGCKAAIDAERFLKKGR